MAGSEATDILNLWLDTFGFTDDPFAWDEAEREDVPLVWIEMPYLDEALGAPDRPETGVLLAGTGDGKTAASKMAAYECAHGRWQGRVLAVRLHEFGDPHKPAGSQAGDVAARAYVRVIVQETLAILAARAGSLHFKRLNSADRDALAVLVATYASLSARRDLDPYLGRAERVRHVEREWPYRILQRLAEIVARLGSASDGAFQALYVLIDLPGQLAGAPQEAMRVLAPLTDPTLLQTPHVAFKFFLPDTVYELLAHEAGPPFSNIEPVRVTWGPGALRQMVDRRVSVYSGAARQLDHFDQLCPALRDYGLEDLIAAAHGSPRALLNLCEALLQHHLRLGGSEYFDQRALQAALSFHKAREAAAGRSGQSRWDVFLSYSDQDQSAVADWLLPRLEAAGLRVNIEYRDSTPGMPKSVCLERAIAGSAHTLIVITDAWLQDEWGEFALRLTQTADPANRRLRLTPLLLAPCQTPLPASIQNLSMADCTDPARREEALQRAIEAVRLKL